MCTKSKPETVPLSTNRTHLINLNQFFIRLVILHRPNIKAFQTISPAGSWFEGGGSRVRRYDKKV